MFVTKSSCSRKVSTDVSIGSFFLFLLMVFFSGNCLADSLKKQTAVLKIQKKDHLFTIRANSVPLQDILTRLSELSDIKFQVFNTLTQPTNTYLQNIAIEDLIKELVGGYNHVIFYQNTSPNSSTTFIKQINIYFQSHLVSHKSIKKEKSLKLNHQESVINQQLDYIDALMQTVDIDVIPELTDLLFSSDNVSVKEYIINSLGNFQGKLIVDALANALVNENKVIKQAIINVLKYQHHHEASLILAQLLYGDLNPDIRKLAAEAIRFKNAEHMVNFLKAAQKDKDEGVRAAAKIY